MNCQTSHTLIINTYLRFHTVEWYVTRLLFQNLTLKFKAIYQTKLRTKVHFFFFMKTSINNKETYLTSSEIYCNHL